MKPLPLMQFIAALSPRFHEPRHLAPFVEALERTEREPVHAVCSVPPRHEKTETLKHAIVRRLRLRPETRIAYVTYASTFAFKKSREIRQLYQRSGGIVVDDANTLADWRTTDTGTDDGGLWSTSVGGPITGEGFDLIIIDDAVKSRAVAESGVEREKQIDWYRDTLSTREEPGASTIYVGARWTPMDLPGHLISEGWETINLPAINEAGEALCPARYPLPALMRIKETLGEYGWLSLYMGRPYAKGGRVFGDVVFYEAAPANMRIGIGVDFAYTKKSKSDYSVAVVIGESAGVCHVLEVVRLQVTAPEFKVVLDDLTRRYQVRPYAYVGGTEKGVVDLLNEKLSFKIIAVPALTDKFVRAQPVSAQWNAGRVLLPHEATWLDSFVSELVSFTGAGDVHDDQVDALAGAYEALRQGVIAAQDAARAELHTRQVEFAGRVAAGLSAVEMRELAAGQADQDAELLAEVRQRTTQNETWQQREARLWAEFCQRGGVETSRQSEIISEFLRARRQ